MKKEIRFEMQVDSNLIHKDIPTERILEILVVPPAAKTKITRPALNLALVIDKSGSMGGEKLAYVKQAAVHVIDLLQENDRISIIAYDSEVEVLSPNVAVTESIRASLKIAIQSIRSGSATNLSGGWLRGCQEVASAENATGINRVLLLTDGLANVGITDLEELGIHASQLLARGVATSTFGVGYGFNEHLLEHMSNQGGGNFYYIDSPLTISRIFEDEFLELVSVTAKDVKVTLEIPAGVSAQVMGNWRSDLKENQLVLWLGDISASQRRELYLKLLTPPSRDLTAQKIEGVLTAVSEDGTQLSVEASLVLKYADSDAVNAAPQQKELMERFTAVQVADRTTEALILERAGEREKAGRILDQTIAMSAPYMSNEVKQDYENLSRRLREGLDEGTRKSRHQDEYLRKRRRDS